MRITGEHGFSASRDRVWDALQDPRLLAASLPGVRRLEPTGPHAFALTVDAGVGAVKGTYEGTFRLEDLEAPESCTVHADVSGRTGSVRARARMLLEDAPCAGARLEYVVHADLTGPLAGVGQRLVGSAARRTTEQFLASLDETIAAEDRPAPADGAQAGAAAPPGTVVAVPEDAGGTDPKVVAASALAGFGLALAAVALGRWTARR
jgi:carbon monoxide dehydrogenase subunit G